MFKPIHLPLLAAGAVVLASAYGCGGSSGGAPPADETPGSGDMSGGGEPDEPFLDPRIMDDDWRHDVAEFARAATGAQEPTLSSSGHDAKAREIAAASDTISMLYYFSEADSNYTQLDPQCSGTTCTFGDPSNPPTTKETFVPAKEDITYFPLMRSNGVEAHILSAVGTGNLGPWQINTLGAVLDHLVIGDSYEVWDAGYEGVARFAWGNSTGSNPAAGAASWSGVMIGTGGRPGLGEAWQSIQGDVTVTANFGNETTVDVVFSDVTGLYFDADYTIDPWTDIPLSGGSFDDGDYFHLGSASRYIQGTFFGPNAEEVGGIVVDENVSDPTAQIGGAFGAVRDAQ